MSLNPSPLPIPAELPRAAELIHAAEIVGATRKRGTQLWLESGQLRYKTNSGTLSEQQRSALRAAKDAIVALLQRTADKEMPEPAPRQTRDPIPLTFAQRAYWEAFRLSERSCLRTVATALRLQGPLRSETLRSSLAELARRHEALRTRIAIRDDGTPFQEILPPTQDGLHTPQVAFDFADLTDRPEPTRDTEIKHLIDALLLEPVDVRVGPLTAVRLLKVDEQQHILIVAMGHMISDGVSLNVFIRDLLFTCQQTQHGASPALPRIRAQYGDYAVWQRDSLPHLLERHAWYWREHLGSCGRSRFPEDPALTPPGGPGWASVPVRIDRDFKRELTNWCRMRGTTLVMAALTAYVALVLRWCNVDDTVFQYQSDGRGGLSSVQNTIGFFASELYLRIRLQESDTFLDVLTRVMDEYCEAHEHSDFSFLATRSPRPGFTRNTAFNWLPRETHTPAPTHSEGEIRASTLLFEHPMLRTFEADHEPGILLTEVADQIVGEISFPRSRFSAATMERFARNFLAFLRTLTRHPENRVKDVVLVE
jgi:hypothetical protein